MLRLLCVKFCKFITELGPLTRVSILFPLNILKINGWNLTIFSIYIDIDKINVEIVMRKILQIYN